MGVAAIGILYKNTFHWIRNFGEWVSWAAIEIFYRNTWAAIRILQRNILHWIHNLGAGGEHFFGTIGILYRNTWAAIRILYRNTLP